jgi:hypothetical protein
MLVGRVASQPGRALKSAANDVNVTNEMKLPVRQSANNGNSIKI